MISEARKDEQRRLIKEGNKEAAEHLKNSKYILMTSEKTRARKEKDAKNGKVISRGSNILDRSPVVQKPGITTRYEDLIEENELLFTIDLIKEELQAAYEKKFPAVPKRYIDRNIRALQGNGEQALPVVRFAPGKSHGRYHLPCKIPADIRQVGRNQPYDPAGKIKCL